MKHEYHEGPDALVKFNALATKLFRAPKPKIVLKEKPTPKGKPDETSKG